MYKHSHWYLRAVSGLMRMKPADCWKLFGPRPLTSFSCSRLKKGPFFSLHSTMLRARLALRPATCLQNTHTSFASSVAYNIQWTFENSKNIHKAPTFHLIYFSSNYNFEILLVFEISHCHRCQYLPYTIYPEWKLHFESPPKGMEIVFHTNQILTYSRVKY